MKALSSHTTFPRIVLDADPVLRGMRLPNLALATFREMKLGEVIHLVNFGGPGYGEEDEGGALAIVTRTPGGFELDACWALDVGKNARKRGHTLVDMRFQILPERRIELLPPRHAREADQRQLCLKLTMKILRRASWLGRMAKAGGDYPASVAMQPNCHRTTSEKRYSDAARWLQGIPSNQR